MTTPLSLIARKGRLKGLRDELVLGGAAAAKFYTGLPPSKPSDAVGAVTLLGTILLATPVGVVGASGDLATLTLSVPRVASASASGTIGWVRLVNFAGDGFMDLMVGLKLPPGSVDTPAPVIVNVLEIFANGELQLVACVIAE